jgi:hypothetical protein
MLGLSFSDRETVQGEEGFEFEFDFDGLEGSSLVDEHEDEDDGQSLYRPLAPPSGRLTNVHSIARTYPSSSRSTFRHSYSRTIPSCPSLSQSFDRSSQSSSSSSSASEGETGRFFPMVFDLTSPTVDMGSVKPLSNLNPTALKSHYQTPAIDFLGSRTRSIHPVSPNTFHPYLDTPDRPLANQLHTPKSDLRAGLHPRSTRSSRITLRSALFAARSDGSGLKRGVNCEEGWNRRG